MEVMVVMAIIKVEQDKEQQHVSLVKQVEHYMPEEVAVVVITMVLPQYAIQEEQVEPEAGELVVVLKEVLERLTQVEEAAVHLEFFMPVVPESL